ncbi:MAG: glycosyltransferase family 4 protein [Anaerolineae bacterium]|nr:glycosyltransferase family 4 protein [Anaerolineae bacterium]
MPGEISLPPAEPLNVLMIALGDEILTGWGDVRERHIEYAGRVNHLHVIAYSPRRRGLSTTRISEHLTVYPTRSTTRPGFILDAFHIGAAICRETPVHVITTQDPFTTGLAGAWLKHRFGIPLHVQNHSDFFDNPFWLAESPLRNRAFNLLGRWVLRRADTCRVVNTAEKAKYVRMGIPEERVAVVPVPVRLERFTPEGVPGEEAALRAALDLPPGAPVVLWVGRPVAVKALPVLIDAFSRVLSWHPEAYLVLGGDFSARGGLVEQVALSGLTERVRFAGRIAHEDLPAWYRLASIFALPSRYEGFGMVLVEAAACGAPVVAARSAGAQEIVLDGETGLLYTVDDAADMAEQIRALLSDPARARQLGERARAHVAERFDRAKGLEAIIREWQRTAATAR